MYYEINEDLARNGQTMNSFRDYVAGSATADYQKAVDEAAELAERQKKKVSTFYHDRIDHLVDTYSRRLAAWTNDYNRNRASCPSIMVCGGSNFPVAKKQKQNAREETLFREYDEIKGILDKIRSVGTGPVDLTDPHAKEILQEQLEKAKKYSEDAKKINAWYRKHQTVVGCPVLSEEAAKKMQLGLEELKKSCPIHDVPFPSYELTSIRGKIKRIEARIEQLEKLKSIPENEAEIEFDGGRIFRNADLNRVQIFFDEKPDADSRQRLKNYGFRWSPRNEAWQRLMTDNAMAAAKTAVGI